MRNIGLLILFSIVFAGCKKEKSKPAVLTSLVTAVTQTSAQCGGTLTSNGSDKITEIGICWSTNPTPLISDSKMKDSLNNENFTCTIPNLSVNTTYFIRAYAVNEEGVGYGPIRTFRTLYGTVTDLDGNVYNTIMIGSQVWMVENLRTTKYRDTTAITLIKDNKQWSDVTLGAYCYYNNDTSNVAEYGLLYNWYAAQTYFIEGWHLPSDSEWKIMADVIGNNSYISYKMKEVGEEHWIAPNDFSTNSSGFSALPGGHRHYDGKYYDLGYYACFWSSTRDADKYYWCRLMRYNNGELYRGSDDKLNGYSVRLVKD